MIRITYTLPEGADEIADDGRLPCVYSFGPCGKCSNCTENAEKGLSIYPERTMRERLDALIHDHMMSNTFAESREDGHSYETAAYDVDDVEDIEEANEHERSVLDEENHVYRELVAFSWGIDPRISLAIEFVPWIIDPDDEDETKVGDEVELRRVVEPKKAEEPSA